MAMKGDIMKKDLVNNPKHYNQGKIECIEAIESAVVNKSGTEAFLVGNIIKYLWRYEAKGGTQDIEKAQWYLNKLLEIMKIKNNSNIDKNKNI